MRTIYTVYYENEDEEDLESVAYATDEPFASGLLNLGLTLPVSDNEMRKWHKVEDDYLTSKGL